MAMRVAWALLAGFVLVGAAVLVAGEPPGDERALTAIRDAAGTSLDPPMQVVADLTDVGPLAVLLGLIVGVLVLRRRTAEAVGLAAAVVTVWVVNPVLKQLVARERPDVRGQPQVVSEYSFPSGHAAGTMALAVALVLLTWGSSWRLPVLTTATVLVVVVAASQLVLGVHYPSDILAGWLVAAACVLVVLRVVRRWERRSDHSV